MSKNSLVRQTYQQLLDTFEGGQIESLLFTSFNFSASFFENNVLPMAAGCSIKDAGNIQAAQVNEALVKTKITVICDRSTFPEPKTNYRYGLMAVGLKDAFFHPKIILAIGTLKNGESVAELVVGSCNLTLSGWGLNRESVGGCKVGKQQADHLLPLIQWLLAQADAQIQLHGIQSDVFNEEGDIRHNLKSIETFLTGNCRNEIDSSPKFILRLPTKDATRTYLDLLTADINQTVSTCRIVSPFWSKREALEPLLTALSEKNGIEHFYFVPSVGLEGKYCFPEDMREYLKNSSQNSGAYQRFKDNDRYTHAKYMNLFTTDISHCFIGSANFTNAAMGVMSRGNVEAMLHYKFKGTAEIDRDFIELKESDMYWADDSEIDDDAPSVSPYVTHAIYDWKSTTFSCVLECSVDKFKEINNPCFNGQPLSFENQKNGSYKAVINWRVKHPVYVIEIPYIHDTKSCLHKGLVVQCNAEEDQLSYSPKPQLSKIMDDLIALDPIVGPNGGGGSKSSTSEPAEEEVEEGRTFDFFSIYQAFYKQRKYFVNHPENDPFRSSSVFSLSVMFRAITLEIESSKNNGIKHRNEDVIYYFILLIELASTAKELADISTFESGTELIDNIKLAVDELTPDFKQLMTESRVLKQFLHTNVVNVCTVEAILKWFKVQVGYTHE